jgi:hypothetical protein
MTTSIPESQIVNILPGVVSAGGNAIVMNGLFLTQNTAVPIGSVTSFPTSASVSTFFGAGSTEAILAGIYFGGWSNSTQKPGNILFTQFNMVPVSAYLRGGQLTSLAQVNALGSGTLTLTIDGVSQTSATIALGAVSSMSAAATAIAGGFSGLNAALRPTCVYDSVRGAFVISSPTSGGGAVFTATTNSTTTVNVTAMTSGTLAVGQYVSGAGIPAGAYITALSTFTNYNASTQTGGTGNITISSAATASASGVAMAANASSISVATGTLSSGLLLTTATGTILSQGAAANAATSTIVTNSTASFMNNIVNNVTQNWATLMTTTDPDAVAYANSINAATGLNVQKLAFSAWVNSTNSRYAYVAWDQDASPTVSSAATSSLGYLVNNTYAYNGTIPIYCPTTSINTPGSIAAFVCGMIASINFSATNGRITTAFKTQSGLAYEITNATTAANLTANGYNFFGSYGTGNQNFTEFQTGLISGVFQWADAYVNQIYLNNQIQLAIASWQAQINSAPFNSSGYNALSEVIKGPVRAAIQFGSINTGVPLSAGQIAAVNAAAGKQVDSYIVNNGYYLQIKPAAAQDRASRNLKTPILWYSDGGSIQNINMSSLLVQ